MEKEKKVSLIDILTVIAKNKKFIFINTTILTVIIFLFVLITKLIPARYSILPDKYIPQAKIIFQEKSKPSMGEVGGIASLLMGSSNLTKADPSATAKLIINDEQFLNNLSEAVNCSEIYNLKSPNKSYECRTELSSNIIFSNDEESKIFIIGYKDYDKERATMILKTLIQQLKVKFIQVNKDKASLSLDSLEEQLLVAETEMKEAQKALTTFQTENGIIDLPSQVQAQMRQVAELTKDIMLKEAELENLRKYRSYNDPMVVQKKEEIKSYNKFLKRVKSSFATDGKVSQSDIPTIAAEFIEVKTEYTINKEIYLLMRKQYETTKISQTDNSSNFQLLNEIYPPERKGFPGRGKICVLGAIASLFLSILLIFIREYFYELGEDIDESAKIDKLKNYLKIRKR